MGVILKRLTHAVWNSFGRKGRIPRLFQGLAVAPSHRRECSFVEAFDSFHEDQLMVQWNESKFPESEIYANTFGVHIELIS